MPGLTGGGRRGYFKLKVPGVDATTGAAVSKRETAHRLVCAAWWGWDPLVAGEPSVLHLCDNDRCVNPHHLRRGSPKQNHYLNGDDGRKWRKRLRYSEAPKGKASASSSTSPPSR